MNSVRDLYRPPTPWLGLCWLCLAGALSIELASSYRESAAWVGGLGLRDPFFAWDLAFALVCLVCMYLYSFRGVEIGKWVLVGWCASKGTDIFQDEIDPWLVAKVSCATIAALILVAPLLGPWLKRIRR